MATQDNQAAVAADGVVVWLDNIAQGRVILVVHADTWNSQIAKVWVKFKGGDGLQQLKNPHTGDAWEPTANDSIDIPSVADALYGISTEDVSDIPTLKLFALPYQQTF